jgi:hypothetical protein
MTSLNFLLNDELSIELVAAARDCELTTREYVEEAVQSVLASRRLPHVRIGTHGAFTSGMRAVRENDEDEPLELITHSILL